jgi:hypothetical protein
MTNRQRCLRHAPGTDDPEGVEPDRMRGTVPANPARGKAQGRIDPRPNVSRGNGPQTGIEAQKSKPASSPAWPPFRSRSKRRMGHPRRKPIGADDRARTARGPGPAEMPFAKPPHFCGGSTRRREQTCEGKNPRSAIGRAEGRTTSPGQAASARTAVVAERRAEKTRRRMTRFGQQSRSGGARAGRIVRERVTGFAGRTGTGGRRRTRCEQQAVYPSPWPSQAQTTDSAGTLFSHASATASTIASTLPSEKPQGRAPS